MEGSSNPGKDPYFGIMFPTIARSQAEAPFQVFREIPVYDSVRELWRPPPLYTPPASLWAIAHNGNRYLTLDCALAVARSYLRRVGLEDEVFAVDAKGRRVEG